MKKILYTILCISLILCTGCSAANAQQPDERYNEVPYRPYYIYYNKIEEPRSSYDLFLNNLTPDSDNYCTYPDSYGGVYVEYDENNTEIYTFLIVGNDYSDYQYLQDAFPNTTKFRSCEYSYNYLCEVMDEYYASAAGTSEKIYSAGIDTMLNRVVITVDEQTLANKNHDDSSPIIFKPGSPMILL